MDKTKSNIPAEEEIPYTRMGVDNKFDIFLN